jgi:hypothetical protein
MRNQININDVIYINLSLVRIEENDAHAIDMDQ